MPARSSVATYTLNYGTTQFATGQFSDAVQMQETAANGAFFTITTNATQTSPGWSDASLDWTIEFFYKRNSTSVDSFERTIVDSASIKIVVDGNFTDKFRITTLNGSGPSYNTGIPTNYIHIALVCDSGNQSLYYNGTRVATGTVASGNSDTTFEFGHEYTGGLNFSSYFDEIRFSQVARYSGASLTVPTASFTNDSDTVALFHFNNTTVDDNLTQGSVNLTVNATLNATANPTPSIVNLGNEDYTWDDTDTWNLFSLIDRWIIEETISSETGLTSSATKAIFASANLTAEFTVSSQSEIVKAAQSNLTSNFEQSVKADINIVAAANLASNFTTSIQGQIFFNGRSDLSNDIQFNCSANKINGGSSHLTSAFELTAQAEEFDIASSLLFGEFTQSVIGGIIHQASANQNLSALLSIKGGIIHQASAGFNNTVEIVVEGLKIRTADSNLTSQLELFCDAVLMPSLVLDDLLVTANLSVNASKFVGCRANLTAFGSTLTVGERLPGGSANLQSQFIINVLGGTIQQGSAGLQAFVANLTDARISNVRGSAALHSQFNGEFAGDLRLLDSEFIYTILSDTRRYRIDSEIRALDILSDTRRISVHSETRGLNILPENRTIDVSKSLVD